MPCTLGEIHCRENLMNPYEEELCQSQTITPEAFDDTTAAHLWGSKCPDSDDHNPYKEELCQSQTITPEAFNDPTAAHLFGLNCPDSDDHQSSPYGPEELEPIRTLTHDDQYCAMAARLFESVNLDPTPTCATADAGEPTAEGMDKNSVVMVPWTPRLNLTITPCTRAFFESNLIDYDVKIMDGFYDPGRSWSSLPALSYVMNHPELASKCRETLVVDTMSDVPLRRFVERCATMLQAAVETRAKVHMLAVMVSNFQGGWNTDLVPRSDKFVQRLRCLLGFNIVPIGQVQHGVCRHRAVLFKYLCDRFAIPCRLIRGNYHHVSGDKEGHSWNVVLLDGMHYLCDVMHDPGMLYSVSCKKTMNYHRDMKLCGRVHVAGPGLQSLPIPPKTIAEVAHPVQKSRSMAQQPSAVLECVEQVQKQCEQLFAVHSSNQALQKQLQESHTELQVKEEQLQRMARTLLQLDPNVCW